MGTGLVRNASPVDAIAPDIVARCPSQVRAGIDRDTCPAANDHIQRHLTKEGGGFEVADAFLNTIHDGVLGYHVRPGCINSPFTISQNISVEETVYDGLDRHPGDLGPAAAISPDPAHAADD